MRSKSWILLVIAIGCGAIASVGISQVVMEQRGQSTGEDLTEILVATGDLDVGTKITSQNIKLEKWPSDRLPIGYVKEAKEIEGKFSGQRFYQGEPMLQRKLMNSVDSVATTIPEGWLIFDISVDEHMGGVGYIKPGDRVNVFGYFEKSGRIPETKTTLVMENVGVIMVDGNAVRDPDEKSGKKSRTIQLLIKESQYEALTTASYLGKMKVALRPPGDKSSKEETDNGDRFLNWIRTADNVADATLRNKVPPTNPFAGNSNTTSSANAGIPELQLEPEKKMLVITPNGISKYVWTNDNQLPELVNDSKTQAITTPRAIVSGITPGTNWSPNPSIGTPGGFAPAYPENDEKPEAPSNGSLTKPVEKGQR